MFSRAKAKRSGTAPPQKIAPLTSADTDEAIDRSVVDNSFFLVLTKDPSRKAKRSGTAPPGKSTFTSKMTSVKRLQQDVFADAAGPPLHMTP